MHPISSPLQVLHFPHTLIINQNTSIQAVYKPFFFFFFPLYMTSHFQNILGSLGLTSHFHFAFVNIPNWDNWDTFYISLALAQLTLGFLWKHTLPFHLLTSIVWHLSHWGTWDTWQNPCWEQHAESCQLNILLGVSSAEWSFKSCSWGTAVFLQMCMPAQQIWDQCLDPWLKHSIHSR